MKKLRVTLLFILIGISRMAMAQELPAEITTALKGDDVAKVTAYLTADNLNACYGNYSLLAQTIRYNAPKCFAAVMAKGANVNQVCNNYKSPLFFAAEYGRVDMAKSLVSKGADTQFKYKDDTLLSIAEKFKRDPMIEYLKTL